MRHMNTPITEKCLERHSEDENDNLKLDINTKGTQNSITLNYDHRPQRGAQKTKLGFVRQLAHKIKESVIGNIIENVIDQCQKDTFVEYASAFDFRCSLSLEDRVILIKNCIVFTASTILTL